MNEYFYQLAQRAAQAAADRGLTNIDPRWIYAQWAHETNGFKSSSLWRASRLGRRRVRRC